MLLRCPPFADGQTSTQIGTNLERGKAYHRAVILPRLEKLEESGVIEHHMPGPLGPRMYRLTAEQGRKLANWLYRDILKRQQELESWDSKWDEALETQEKSKIEKVRAELIDTVLAFLYYL